MNANIEVPIDHHHDYFKITTAEPSEAGVWDDGEDEVMIELWSRGSFTVKVALSSEDAEAFGEALIKAAQVAAAELVYD